MSHRDDVINPRALVLVYLIVYAMATTEGGRVQWRRLLSSTIHSGINTEGTILT